MRLDSRFRMSLSNNPEQPEKGINRSETNTMVLSDEKQLPGKVANVSRDELRKYAQCKAVGNYLLGRTVGEGSFAKVKEAIHILTGEKVAIKIIDKNRARKDRYVSKNMRREARLLQMIRHPHIVQLLEIVETSQCYYLVFEFAHGGDLMDHICKRRKLDEDEVRKYTRQIISAVEYLHRLGIMHRDLKVENLLLDGNKNIKIIDFGLSNTIYSQDPNNENHCSTQCGSPAYAAPELLVRNDYGPQIDVWSIGVNLYAMLTGRLPYTVEPFNISTLYNKMLKRQMNPIPEHLSEACKDMIYQLLNPDPKERLHVLEAVRHPWITMDQKDPLVLIPCPNYLNEEDLDDRILDHVEEQLKLNSDDVIRDVIQNKATKNSCVYHLLVIRLERYERDQRKSIKSPPPTIQLSESKGLSSPEHVPSSSPNHHNATPKNGLVKRSSPKTHIMENPFKTIKVALARQKKVAKNEEKTKSDKLLLTQESTSNSTTNSTSTKKPTLCAVKRVALVKFSPARRSFRGLTGGARNSPKPGRRRTYFEGLQQRRKSPKVRRRHVEPDDSLSSNVSTPRRTSIDVTDGIRPTTQCIRIEDQINNNNVAPDGSKTLLNNASEMGSTESVELQACNIKTVSLEKKSNKDCATNASDTVTHLYTEKGVVLKRNSSEGKQNINYEQEQATVQHHVFHSEQKTKNNGSIESEQGCQRVNVISNKQEIAESSSLKPEVANAKTPSVPSKISETGKQTSQRLSFSSTPISRQTPKEQTLNTKPVASKQIPQKQVVPRRTPYRLDNSSKIPVIAGKSSVPSRQSPMSSTRSTPKTTTSSMVSNKHQGTVRKNEVARLADKYDKCVSVIVVDRSKDIGASSSADGKSSIPVGKSSLLDSKRSATARRCSDSFGESSSVARKGFVNNRIAIKARVANVECGKDESKTRREISDKTNTVKRRAVSKIPGPIIKEQAEPSGKTLKLDGKNTKENIVKEKGKELKKITGQNVNRLQRQDQQNAKSSLVKSPTENHSRTTCVSKNNVKQTSETARKNLNNDRTGKVQRSSIKSQEAKNTKSWTGDERRKISNYKKTNEAQKKGLE